MSVNWNIVTPEHVREACRQVDSGRVKCLRPAHTTFLILNTKRYPAKFIRGLAYEVATGQMLNPNVDFSGGAETARFLRGRGFEVEYHARTHDGRKGNRQTGHASQHLSTNNMAGLDKKQQKAALRKVLEQEFGSVSLNQDFDWLVVPGEESMDQSIARVRACLAGHRGFQKFSNPGLRLRCDFHVPAQRLIVEYDERQHFTESRALCLEQYPEDLRLGFDRQKWISACRHIRARDDDPPYRDEQRAFYDTLRDVLASRNGFTLIRMTHGDWDWNHPGSREHLRRLVSKFATHITPAAAAVAEDWRIEIRTDPKPRLGRVIFADGWRGNVETARRFLEQVCKAWPNDVKVDCLVTCGAFLRFDWPAALPPVGDYAHPRQAAVDTLLKEAKEACEALLDGALQTRLARCACYLTLGVDSPFHNKITTTQNRISVPHLELVCLVDLRTTPPQYHWTGKSYPTVGQAATLVRINDLKSYFWDLDIGKVMVLGCHDLTMFNPRAQVKAEGWRKDIQIQFRKIAKREAPAVALHHPHTTVKTRTWLNAWNQLSDSLPSVSRFAGAGRYHEDDRAVSEWDDLDAVLQSTKRGPTVDVIARHTRWASASG